MLEEQVEIFKVIKTPRMVQKQWSLVCLTYLFLKLSCICQLHQNTCKGECSGLQGTRSSKKSSGLITESSMAGNGSINTPISKITSYKAKPKKGTTWDDVKHELPCEKQFGQSNFWFGKVEESYLILFDIKLCQLIETSFSQNSGS